MAIKNSVDLNGIHRVILEGRYRQLQLLIQLGADVNQGARDGLTPLMRCCLLDKERVAILMFRYLCYKGANLHAKDKRGRSVLTYAVMYGRSGLVRVLCRDEEVDLLDRDQRGYTALHYAGELGHVTVLTTLISHVTKRDMDLDIKAHDGSGPSKHQARQ